MSEFLFVSGHDPSVPENNAVRTLIRKQAMKKAAAARRQAGNYGKHNLLQYPPVFLENCKDPSPEIKNRRKRETHKATTSSRSVLDISLRPSQSGYELMRSVHGWDILNLSALTTFHVDRTTGPGFLAHPSQVADLLHCRQVSYLTFLPSHYGNSSCLQDAANCVAARVREVMLPSTAGTTKQQSRTRSSLYVKALVSLQRALNSPIQRLEPDVLCATELLALYELLCPSQEAAWVQHVAGAARLIQLRGPQGYSTDFEKALFVAHLGPIITESLLNNEPCFLAQEGWVKILQSVIDPESLLSDRSEAIINLLIHMASLCGVFADVTYAVCRESSSHEVVWELQSKTRYLRSKLLGWRDDYPAAFKRIAYVDDTDSFDKADYGKRCALMGVYLCCVIISNRLLISVSPSTGLGLEKETQELADQILVLESKVKSCSPAANLLMTQKIALAWATKDTATSWRETCKDESREGRMVARRVFEQWCGLFGRNFT